MGPGREPKVCENEELVSEFELACRSGDYEFADEYKKEIIRRFGVISPNPVGKNVALDKLEKRFAELETKWDEEGPDPDLYGRLDELRASIWIVRDYS